MTRVAFLPMFILLLLVVPLLVLFIRLCIRKPKVAVIIASVPLVFIASIFLVRFFSFYISHIVPVPVRQITNYSNNGRVVQTIQYPNTSSQSAIINNSSANQAPIWSEGIEDQFEADVYPSKMEAVRELGRKINKTLPLIMESIPSLQEIEIFQHSQDLKLVEELQNVIAQFNPDIKCKVVLDIAAAKENIIGIYFSINTDYYSAKENVTSGTIRGNILTNQGQQASVPVSFAEKPWVENFAKYSNSYPNRQFIVAKSADSCIAPEEANQQAMKNACYQVEQLITNPGNLDYNSLLESGIVTDNFMQSLNGSVGKIWRQAILLDVSNQKLNHLADILSGAARARSMNWARMVFSIIGLFVLITIVYIFLNAATRGYYAWSLRIVGVILAAIFLLIILRIA